MGSTNSFQRSNFLDLLNKLGIKSAQRSHLSILKEMYADNGILNCLVYKENPFLSLVKAAEPAGHAFKPVVLGGMSKKP